MPTALPLKSMTKIEKPRAMEELWTDLTRDADRFDSPQWHLRELQATEARVLSGAEKFVDWDAAKKSLRRRAR